MRPLACPRIGCRPVRRDGVELAKCRTKDPRTATIFLPARFKRRAVQGKQRGGCDLNLLCSPVYHLKQETRKFQDLDASNTRESASEYRCEGDCNAYGRSLPWCRIAEHASHAREQWRTADWSTDRWKLRARRQALWCFRFSCRPFPGCSGNHAGTLQQPFVHACPPQNTTWANSNTGKERTGLREDGCKQDRGPQQLTQPGHRSDPLRIASGLSETFEGFSKVNLQEIFSEKNPPCQLLTCFAFKKSGVVPRWCGGLSCVGGQPARIILVCWCVDCISQWDADRPEKTPVRWLLVPANLKDTLGRIPV